jgi:soluble lytic murein transglycosylase-like protein
MMKHSSLKRFRPLTSIGLLLLLAVLSLCTHAQAEPQPASRFDGMIRSIASHHGLEPSLIHSIIQTESDYDPYAVSPKGAAGLMQLMPETAKRYGVRNVFDPWENIEGGVKYIKDLMKLFGQKTDHVLAAYNAGQNAVKKYGGIPPYPETERYINKVKAAYPKSTIRNRNKIYKYYDSSGRIILTNCSFLYSQGKSRNQENKD